MDVVCHQQVVVHHPLNLLPQPDHQLHAGGCQVHAGQGEDRPEYDQWPNISQVPPG